MAKSQGSSKTTVLKKFLKDDGSDHSLDEEGYQRRNTIQKITFQRNMTSFVCKVLVTKILQQLLTMGYIVYVIIGHDQFYTKSTIKFVLIPIIFWWMIFVAIHFVYSAPNYCISAFLLVVMSLSLGFFVGEVHYLIHYYFLFLPATLVALTVTNICFLPFFLVSKLNLNVRRMCFYIIPQLMNLLINIIMTGTWAAMILTEKFPIKKVKMRTKVDAIMLFGFPTFFWSASLTLLMTYKLKLVLTGQLLSVSHQEGEYIFIPCHFI